MLRPLTLTMLAFATMPGCLCGVLPEHPTTLADWPQRTLVVSVTTPNEGGTPQPPVIEIELGQPAAEADACPVLGTDANWFAGDAGGILSERGHVEYGGTGGGDLTLSPFVKPLCITPAQTLPIDASLGTDARIVVGVADASDSWSTTIRRPPTAPAMELVDLESGAVVTRGQEVALRSNAPLDGPDTRFDVTISQCHEGDFDCTFHPLSRLEGSDVVVVTIPGGAASAGASILVDVVETFRSEACTTDACEADSELTWTGRVEVTVQ